MASPAALAPKSIDALEVVEVASTANRRCSGTEKLFDRMNAFEAPFVRWVVVNSQGRWLRRVSLTVNRLGNGWLYLAIAMVLFALTGLRAWRPILAAGGAAAIAVAGYCMMKPSLGRLRPFTLDPTLPCPVDALDTYSCPSGHCMTFCAVGLVLASRYPYTTPAVVIGLMLMGWARIALAHHYGSDVVVGIALGFAISLSVCHFVS